MRKRCAVVSSDDEDEDEVVSEDMEAVLYQAELLQHMEDEHKRNLAESESPRLLVHARDTMEAAEPHGWGWVGQTDEGEGGLQEDDKEEAVAEEDEEAVVEEKEEAEAKAEAKAELARRYPKRALAEAAFRHAKVHGAMVHAHPSLDDDEVNAVLQHVSGTKYAAAKDLFLMVCNIEGAILVVSPRMEPTQPGEGRGRLACDDIAHINGDDMRILTPLLIYCTTASASQAVTDAVSGADVHAGELCLICSRPFIVGVGTDAGGKQHHSYDVGLSLQVRVLPYRVGLCGAPPPGLCGAPPLQAYVARPASPPAPSSSPLPSHA